jgi:hypothetical protein
MIDTTATVTATLSNTLSNLSTPSLRTRNNSTSSLLTAIHRPFPVFPVGTAYYVYKPANEKQLQSLPSRVLNILQLYYYKYLLHTAMYAMTPNERVTINVVLFVIVLFFWYYVYQLMHTLGWLQ